MGINTSFLQLTRDDYKGKLALHTNQFHHACGGDGPGWVKQHDACILITHHPPAWLDSESQKHLNGEITCHGHFTVHLCGHLHEARSLSISEAGTEARRIFQGRSLFGFEHFGQEKERLHGYTAGRLEISENQGTLIFWPREARLQGQERNLVPDNDIKLTDNQHTEPVLFKLNRSSAVKKTVKLKAKPGKKPVKKKDKPDTDRLFQDEIRAYCNKAEALHEKLPLAGFKTHIRVPSRGNFQ